MKKLVLFLSVLLLSMACEKTRTCDCKSKMVYNGGQVLEQEFSQAIDNTSGSEAKEACKLIGENFDKTNKAQPIVTSSVTNCNLK